MPLTDTQIRNAKPGPKPMRLTDGGGLYLLVAKSGGKWWRLDYRFEGKRKTLSMGVYSDVGLKLARTRRDEARQLLANGVDPSEHRKVTKRAERAIVEDTFEAVAREWFAKFSDQWVPSHAERTIRRLERDIFPLVGRLPVEQITAQDLLKALQQIEARGALETAHRTLQNCSQVLRYAVATGRAERDPAADLKGALPPSKGGHFAALTDPAKVGALLRAIDDYEGFYSVRYALKLAPLTFVRPSELRLAEWAEVDMDAAQWSIPPIRMKMREPHIVPLSRQAVSILRELHAYSGDGQYLFPSPRSTARAMSNNALLAALRRMGYTKEEMTPHGFRAMARTLLDEVLGYRPDYIEQQLAHAVKDPLGRAYNRTKHLPKRREMMQRWGDYLDALRVGSELAGVKTGG